MATSSPYATGLLELARRVREVPKTVQPIACASWHGRRADAAADGVDQDPLARPQPRLGLQGVVRSEEDLGDSRGLLEVEVRGDRHGHPLGRDDVFGLPPAADDPEDPVADLERPGDARPERLDLAGELQARDVGRHSRRRRVIAPALHQVGPVQPARPHPDPDLVAPAAPAWERRGLPAPRGPPGPVMTIAFMGMHEGKGPGDLCHQPNCTQETAKGPPRNPTPLPFPSPDLFLTYNNQETGKTKVPVVRGWESNGILAAESENGLSKSVPGNAPP